jgi:hypothetical protein
LFNQFNLIYLFFLFFFFRLKMLYFVGTVPVPRQRRTQYTELARKEKVGSSREKLSRGKELKPSKGNSTNPSFCYS